MLPAHGSKYFVRGLFIVKFSAVMFNVQRTQSMLDSTEHFHYLAPGGGCEVLFSPGLSVCVSVCLSVCVSVCPANILIFFIARLLEEISILN